jgi:tetratricopeptide (TPR) repeat protein
VPRGFSHWLDRLAGQKLDTKLRVLLLDREAPEGFGWWRELTGSGLNTARERRDLMYASRPTQLPDLSDLKERRELMQAALTAGWELRIESPRGPQIPEAGLDPDFDTRLGQPLFGNPLALVMAGVIAVDREPRAALALRHLETARRLGRRELDRFAALARARRVGDDAMRHIVAFNGLVGGILIADLRKSVADELAASRRSADLDAVVALLEQELPTPTPLEEVARDPRLATTQPDLIGEAAIIEAFTGETSRELEASKVVLRAYALAGKDAARVLVRLLQDFAYAIEDESATEHDKATAQRIMGWLLNLARNVDDAEHLLPLVSALPQQTMILREPAADLTERHFLLSRREAERTNERLRWIRTARLAGAFAIRLSALGRSEEALTVAEEAVRLHRALAMARPDAFDPDLAGSLNNLANSLSELGRHEEALTAAEEAVLHFRALVAERPDAFIPGLASSLNNLATMVSALGRHEEALTAAEEAVRFRRRLAAARPDAFTPDLASSLTNLATRLSDLGQRVEALATAEEAVRLYRALAAARPDAFTPDLASSLTNLANMLAELGRREEALVTAADAVRLYRALAAARPDAFTPDLALSHNNLASMLSDVGRLEEALNAVEEAVRFRRALAAAQPDAFTPDLAMSLSNLATILSQLGRRREALTTAEEAVHLYRALAAARPDAFIPELARSLNNLANRLSALGRREEALRTAEEAVHLRRALAAARPDAFTPNLARSLNNLANMLADLGRGDEAVTTAEEEVRLHRTLAAARPDVFGAQLAQSLWVLGDLYGETEKTEAAIAASGEGVRFLTPIFISIPAALAEMMGGLLQSYRTQCAVAGRKPDDELLEPVIAEFERLNVKEEDK